MKAFWQALATAEFKGDLLELPEGVYFLGLCPYGSRMMRREVHWQLMDIADELAERGCTSLVVPGTPGVGKSWWLFFVLWEAAHRGVTVVLQHHCQDSRFLFSGGTVLQGSLQDDFRGALSDPATWYLVDGMAPTEVAARTFAAVSPDYEQYWDYLKAGGGVTEANVAVRFMPVWRLDELLRARELVFPHLPQQLVKQLYAKWGGVPRYCLQFAQDKQRQRDLASALGQHDLMTLLMDAVGCLEGESGEPMRDAILHWAVSSDLEEETVVFASKHVAQEVVRRLRRDPRVDLARALTACMGNQAKAPFASALFEAIFHNLMQVLTVPQPLIPS